MDALLNGSPQSLHWQVVSRDPVELSLCPIPNLDFDKNMTQSVLLSAGVASKAPCYLIPSCLSSFISYGILTPLALPLLTVTSFLCH